MTNVIGPIEKDVWYTLRQLREDIRETKKNNSNGMFDLTISKEEDLFRFFMDQALGRNDNEQREAA